MRPSGGGMAPRRTRESDSLLPEGWENVEHNLLKLDAFPKYVKDFREQTVPGAIISLVAIAIIVVLAISEISYYMNSEKVEKMVIDTVRDERVRLNLDITFPSTPCAAVMMSAQDVTGRHNSDLMHNIFKKRLSKDGAHIGAVERNKLGSVVTNHDELLAEKQKAISEGRPTMSRREAQEANKPCGDCYGAASGCCNTCEEVREAYKKKGWSFDARTVTQCQNEAGADLKADSGEGCSIYGFVRVPKVSGAIHFSPAQSFQSMHLHVEDLADFTNQRFNASHRVASLSFGPYFTDRVNPLDDLTVSVDSPTVVQYYAKVVPTEYRYKRRRTLVSNQYSATKHVRKLAATSTTLPGVFVNYEFSPVRVEVDEKPRPLGSFLTSLCAIVGGVFVVMGLIDSLVHQLLRGRRGQSNLGR